MRRTIVVGGGPAIVSSNVQRHYNLQKLFDNMGLHLIVLDIHTENLYPVSAHRKVVNRID